MSKAKERAARSVPMQQLLKGLAVTGPELEGKEISGIICDSRKVFAGCLFVAVQGLTVDGHDFLDIAATKGCGAVVVNAGRCRDWNHPETPCVEVADTRLALGRIATEFYGNPAERLVVVGITGTNGKTTTTYLLESVIRRSGGNPGVIGTVNYRYNDVVMDSPFTTPDPVLLQKILADMVSAGVTHVVMEVSSHALEQKRVAGMEFDVALFTNLTRDHLDFHGSMESYYASKKRLFAEHLKGKGKAVVITEPDAVAGRDWGKRLTRELLAEQKRKKGPVKMRIIECGFTGEEISILEAQHSLDGIQARIATPEGELKLRSGLVGRFNLKNLLGAFGVGVALGFSKGSILQGLEEACAAPGRLERVKSKAGVGVFVDYAHTPDALENVLQTLRGVCSGRLFVVFGCGGDRDRGKRPLMGKVAGLHADVVVLTSDNPRSEKPEAILAEIESGIMETAMPRMRLECLMHCNELSGYDIIVSRREAIRAVARHAEAGDVVAICGKGHETYQITCEGKIFFDDRVEAELASAFINW